MGLYARAVGDEGVLQETDFVNEYRKPTAYRARNCIDPMRNGLPRVTGVYLPFAK